MIPLTEVAIATVGPGTYVTTDREINGEITLSETDKKVLSAIQQNPHIKRQELISSLEIGKGTLDRSLKKLKGKGILRRIGSNKTGYWKCVL
ncbi:winged helix-turn-helix transcriptional regulator [bacterium 1xD42-87]|nr:winged helix-turn-helix transcriptional regulator [bacterium 1xD42-87]